MNNMDVFNDTDLNLTLAKHYKNLGEYLRTHREQKLLSLEELSQKTKIRIQQLVHLEENNFLELPNQVYLKGFIKAICRELDANVEFALHFLSDQSTTESALTEVKEEVKEELKDEAKGFLQEIAPEEKKKEYIRRIYETYKNPPWLITSAIVFFIGASFIGNLRRPHRNEEATIVHKRMNFIEVKTLFQPEAITDLAPPASVPLATPAPAPAPASAPNSTKLLVKASKGMAFLVYRVNGKEKKKLYLQKGKSLELEGHEIRMDIGNPDAVELTKNGEALAIKPKPGEAVLKLQF